MPTLTYLEAISEALREEMRRDEKVFLLGEDIEVFGAERVVDTPISESGFVGAACGAAVMGYRPVVEFQFADFFACAFDQIVNFAAKCYYRWACPCPSSFAVHRAAAFAVVRFTRRIRKPGSHTFQ